MIPLALVTGFLGGGKTTLLKQLATRYRGRRIVYLVNEFSSQDVDAAVLAGQAAHVVSIAGGSIFCRCMVTEFIERLRELPRRFGLPIAPVEAVIVEASGIANPAVAAQMLRESRLDRLYDLHAIVAVVDPASFLKLLQTLPNVKAQIEAAGVVLINKIDLHPAALIDETESAVRALNPLAKIIRTSHCAADIDLLRAYPVADVQGELAPCIDPHFEKFEIAPSGELDIDHLRAAVAALRDEIYRIKGFASSGGGMVHIDYSATGWEIEPADGESMPAIAIIVRGPVSDAVRKLLSEFT